MNIFKQSFDAAHRGRCPGCGMIDEGSHIGHRYQTSAPCNVHKYEYQPGKCSSYPDECRPTPEGLKAVARFHARIRKDLISNK